MALVVVGSLELALMGRTMELVLGMAPATTRNRADSSTMASFVELVALAVAS